VAQRSESWGATGNGRRFNWTGGLPIWQLIVFLALGALLSLATIIVMGHLKRNTGPLIIFLIFAGPPTAIFLATAMYQGWVAEWALLKDLKWWHWLWFVCFMSGLILRHRTVQESYNSPVDSAAAYRVTLVSVTAVWLFLRLFARKTHWIQPLFTGLVACLAVFGMYSAVTTIWSVFPAWSLYKACEYCVDVAILAGVIYAAHTVEDYKSLFDWTWTLLGASLATAYMGMVLWPKDALERGFNFGLLNFRLRGVFPEQGANRIGDLSAIMVIVGLIRFMPLEGKPTKRSWYIFMMGFGVVALFLSQTRSAILGLAVGVCLFLWFSKRVTFRMVLTWGVVALLAGILFLEFTDAGALVLAYMRRGQSDEQLATLSGRVLWWATAWRLYGTTPLGIGMGAWAAERVPALTRIGLGTHEQLHSDYVETILGTGFYGLAPLFLSLAGTWWMIVRTVRDRAAPLLERQLSLEAIGVLGVLTVRTVFQNVMTLHPALHYFVLVGFAEWLRRKYTARRRVDAFVTETVAN
jgi:hypothetical protein